mgnify:CR=1 FL=1
MWSNIIDGLGLFSNWQALSAVLIAIPIGLIFGILPGLSGLTALAILIPFVYGMEPFVGLAFLIAAHAVTTTSGALPSILLGIPGTPPSAATVIDGYPLSKQGRGGYASGAALASSAIGGVLGCVAFALLIPILQPIILSFGSPETFILMLIGLLFLASVGSGSTWSGLVAGMFGIFLSFFGYEAISGIPRFWMGSEYLLDGLNLIPIALGLFAVPEIIKLIQNGKPIASEADNRSIAFSDVFSGMRDTLKHWITVVQSALIGIIVGLVPGVGGETAPFVAYGAAKKRSKEPKKFGDGAIEGVIAPESTNNAKEGGALVPTLALGIPGSSGMAVLLGGFIVMGIQPGPEFLRNNSDIGIGLAAVLGFSNVLGALLVILFMPYLARVTLIPGRILAPILLMLVVLGAYTTHNSFIDVIFTLLFGLVAIALEKAKLSRAALLLGFVLGAAVERYLNLSLNFHGPAFIFRPITLTIIIIAAVIFIFPYISKLVRKRP